MDLTSRRNLILEGIAKCQTATTKAVEVKNRTQDPDIRQLAEAIHFLSFGAHEMGLALSDESRVNDLPR